MDTLNKAIINTFQAGIAITPRPFAAFAKKHHVTEEFVVACIQHLLEDNILTRFGPLYNADKMGGAFCLCAMQVPASDFEHISHIVNTFDEVAHNYKRKHPVFTMWFVLATETQQDIQKIQQKIEQATQLRVYLMPKLKEFFVHLQLPVTS